MLTCASLGRLKKRRSIGFKTISTDRINRVVKTAMMYCDVPAAMPIAATAQMVAAVVPPEQLMPTAMERARRLNDGPRQTYALIKQGLERALDLDLEQAMELESQLQSVAAETTDAQEAIQAFLTKRKPQFGRVRRLKP